MSEAFLPAPRPVPAAIPPLLGFTAGFVDACTALALFGLFVAQVTGSFVLAAVAFVTKEQGAVTKVLAIPVFLLAAVVTTALAVLVERRGRAAIAWALGLECAVLTSFLAAVLIGAPLSNPNAAAVVVASLLGLFAMGTQSATVRLLMRSMASTQRDDHQHHPGRYRRDRARARLEGRAPRARRRRRRGRLRGGAGAARAACSIMLGFLLGTAAGTLAYVTSGVWGLLLPLAIMWGIFAWASVGRE
jgi:uncharacterized membrane protein YoaK (UPF0700 family)